MSREVPTLDLEQVDVLANSQSPAYQYFHTFGLLKQEFQHLGKVSWTLFDEIKEVKIRLNGALDGYSKPKPGDVVRIHRLTINKLLKTPEISHPRNVVIWPAFRHEPEPITSARAPTIADEDNRRRRILETYFVSKVHRVREYKSSVNAPAFLNVAGCLENSKLDIYGHIELSFTDGTGQSLIRIFKKTNDAEVGDHFEAAEKLRRGDYFIATNVKLDRNGERLNLSANNLHGRSFRLVEQSSILGVILTNQLKLNQENDNNNHVDTSNNNNNNAQGSQVNPNSDGLSTRRRSPRLAERESQSTTQSQASAPASGAQDTNQDVDGYRRMSNNNSQSHDEPAEITPTYTPFSEFKPREFGYEFHDIIGQVRAEPHPSMQFGNLILQIYDGSQHNLSNYHLHEVRHLVEGCLILYVYSKQKESDTDEHFEIARKLKEGELIHVRNVRVSFKSGKVKLELSANKNHNKSISVIDKETRFARRFLDMIETPPVEELREMIDPSYESSQE